MAFNFAIRDISNDSTGMSGTRHAKSKDAGYNIKRAMDISSKINCASARCAVSFTVYNSNQRSSASGTIYLYWGGTSTSTSISVNPRTSKSSSISLSLSPAQIDSQYFISEPYITFSGSSSYLSFQNTATFTIAYGVYCAINQYDIICASDINALNKALNGSNSELATTSDPIRPVIIGQVGAGPLGGGSEGNVITYAQLTNLLANKTFDY